MTRWWTPAHDEAAKHLAKKIKEAKDAGDADALAEAWRKYDELHGVKFGIARYDAADGLIGEPVLMHVETDADLCIANLPVGTPPAAKAVLYACERPDVARRTWRWDDAAKRWTPVN